MKMATREVKHNQVDVVGLACDLNMGVSRGAESGRAVCVVAW